MRQTFYFENIADKRIWADVAAEAGVNLCPLTTARLTTPRPVDSHSRLPTRVDKPLSTLEARQVAQ